MTSFIIKYEIRTHNFYPHLFLLSVALFIMFFLISSLNPCGAKHFVNTANENTPTNTLENSLEMFSNVRKNPMLSRLHTFWLFHLVNIGNGKENHSPTLTFLFFFSMYTHNFFPLCVFHIAHFFCFQFLSRSRKKRLRIFFGGFADARRKIKILIIIKIIFHWNWNMIKFNGESIWINWWINF